MASSILKYLLLGGAAYVTYEWWKSQPTSSSTTGTTGGGSSSGGSSPVVYTPPTTLQQLNTAAGSANAMLNADQWSYYWQQIGKPAIDAATFSSVFFPQGRPPDGTAEPTMTATSFLGAISSKGFSGLGGKRVALPIPRLLVRAPYVRNSGFGGYGIADFRRAVKR